MAARWAKLYKGTEAEHAIEPAVASLGVPYRTQYPFFLFGPLRYFADFLLPKHGLVIEVDDASHKRKKAADAVRTAALNRAGYLVVRCTNAEAMKDPYGTVNRMIANVPSLRGLTAEPVQAARVPRRRATSVGTDPKPS